MDLIKAKGGKVTREPGPVKGGKSVIAFIEDPDGYKFELIERGPTPEPLCQVMLRVGDLDRSIEFYEKVFFFSLLNIDATSTSFFLFVFLCGCCAFIPLFINLSIFFRHLEWSFSANEIIPSTK